MKKGKSGFCSLICCIQFNDFPVFIAKFSLPLKLNEYGHNFFLSVVDDRYNILRWTVQYCKTQSSPFSHVWEFSVCCLTFGFLFSLLLVTVVFVRAVISTRLCENVVFGVFCLFNALPASNGTGSDEPNRFVSLSHSMLIPKYVF